MIALIVARAENGVIGRNNDLPWHLPADLKHFKETTTGHMVVMGRKTFESIYKRLRGPLPNRRNIVVSSTLTTPPQGFEVFKSLENALQASTGQQVFVIGGTTLFNECLDKNLADEIYLTEVHATVKGDVYFPALEKEKWQELDRVDHDRDHKNPYAYSFVHLRRRR